MNFLKRIKNRIVKATILMMKDNPFYGNFMIGMNREKCDDVPTLGLKVGKGGISFGYNKENINQLTTSQVAAEMVHNIHHLVHGHIDRTKNIPSQNRKIANLAADLAVNDVIRKDVDTSNLVLPEHLGLPRGVPYETYYDILVERGGKKKGPSSGSGSESGKEREDEKENKPKDDKSDREGSKESEEQERGSSKERDNRGSGGDRDDSKDNDKEGKDNNSGRGGGSGASTENMLDDMANWGLSHKQSQDFNEMKSSADHAHWAELEKIPKKMLKAIIKNKVRTAYRNAGKIPSNLQELINELLKDTETTNWRRQLRMFAARIADSTRRLTWKRRNKRYGGLLPGKVREWTTDLVVILDTSGSISAEDYKEFKSEIAKIAGILKKITVIECDAQIQKEYKFSSIRKVSFTGRGGTLFSPAIKRAKELKPGGIIYFTDGYPCEAWPEELGNLLWVICSEGLELDKVPHKRKLKIKRDK